MNQSLRRIGRRCSPASPYIGTHDCDPALADPPLPGAVFTTDINCNGVDLNIYGSKLDV